MKKIERKIKRKKNKSLPGPAASFLAQFRFHSAQPTLTPQARADTWALSSVSLLAPTL
jgi:hypothetical protein